MSKIKNDVLKSNTFINAHPSAQKICKRQIESLDKKGMLEESDELNLHLLISTTSLMFHLQDAIERDGVTFVNAKGVVASHPSIKDKNACSRQIQSILAQFGGDAKSRRVLNSKELAQAETNELDNLFQDDKMSATDVTSMSFEEIEKMNDRMKC